MNQRQFLKYCERVHNGRQRQVPKAQRVRFAEYISGILFKSRTTCYKYIDGSVGIGYDCVVRLSVEFGHEWLKHAIRTEQLMDSIGKTELVIQTDKPPHWFG